MLFRSPLYEGIERTATLSLPVPLRKYPATRLAECLTTGYGYPGEVGTGATDPVLAGRAVLACLFWIELVAAEVAAAAELIDLGVQNVEYMSSPFVIPERFSSTTASLGIAIEEPLANVRVVLAPGYNWGKAKTPVLPGRIVNCASSKKTLL